MQINHMLANVFGIEGFIQLMVVLIIGLLIFGKRLPEVGRSLGKSITEFKKGIAGVGDAANPEVSEPRLVTSRTVPAQLPNETVANNDGLTQEQRLAKLTE